MSTTLEKNDQKTSAAQAGLPGNASQITHPDPGEIINPELRRIAEDVLNAARLSMTNVVAKTTGTASAKANGKPGAVESALALFLQKLPPNKRADAQMRAQQLLRADPKSKEQVFGRFAGINTNAISATSVQQVLNQAEPFKIDPAKLGFAVQPKTLSKEPSQVPLIDLVRFAALWGGSLPTALKEDKTPDQARLAASIITGKVEFVLNSLKCIDETGNAVQEKLGDDEMAVSGVAVTIIDNTTGATSTKGINEIFLGKKYSDGVEQSLGNAVFADFSIAQTVFWPKRFAMTLILAEKDLGGLADVMKAVWDEVGPAVTKALQAAAFAAGVSIGVFLGAGPYAILVGAALAAATKWLVDKLWKWIMEAINDDAFPPATVWIQLESISDRWNGSTTSPLKSENFKLADGEYQLNYQWRLTDMPAVDFTPDPKKQYKIMAKHSGMCLNVPGSSMVSGPVVQWPYAGGKANELWSFEPVGDGYYKITARHSGKCFDIQGAYLWDGAPLHQHDYWGGENQKFRIEMVSDGFFKIVAKHSGKCLNVADASLKAGAAVIQWPYTGTRGNDLWQIAEVQAAATGDDMQPNEMLGSGQSVNSGNGRFHLVYQGDGNLVLYDGNKPLWASNTSGKSVVRVVMQDNGNLVIFNAENQQVWNSGTQQPGSRLVVQSDGNMVIYQPDGKPVWATNTWQAK